MVGKEGEEYECEGIAQQHEARRVIRQLVRQLVHVLVHLIAGLRDLERLFVDLVFFSGFSSARVLATCRGVNVGGEEGSTYDGLRVFGARGAEPEFAQAFFGLRGEGVEAGFACLVRGSGGC